ncbi:MAG TPA: hypothetical protein VGY56_04055 [Verrucomicrobiae bacterium]|nr:hypothetical protein [Verrucomicrobiae bacterium]
MKQALPGNEAVIRLACIVGACACVIYGMKIIYDNVAYHMGIDTFTLLLTLVPFLPIILAAPRYRNGTAGYLFIGLAEVIIVVLYHFVTPR